MNKGVNAGIFFALFGFLFVGFILTNIVFIGFRMWMMFMPMIIFFLIFGFAAKLMRNIASGAVEDKAKRNKRCDNCERLIPSDAKYCPDCGMFASDEVICEYCGAANSTDSFSCKECNGLLK